MRAKFVSIAALLVALTAGSIPALAQSPHLGPLSIISGSPDSTGDDVGQYASFKIDPRGGQHISYFDATHNRLKYAWRPNPAQPWRLEVLDEQGAVGRFTDLSVNPFLDDNTVVHVDTGSTTVTRVSGLPFSPRYVMGTVSVSPHVTISDVDSVVDSDHLLLTLPYPDVSTTGTAHFIYYQPAVSYQDFSSTASLKVARPAPGGLWFKQTVDSSAYSNETTHTLLVGYDTSLTLDSANHIHVAYQDRTPDGSVVGELRYAYFDGSQWTRRIIDSTPGAGYRPSIEIGNDDRPLIFHFNENDGQLRYSTPLVPGPGWLTDFVIGGGAGVGLSSVRFEEGNKLFCGYVAATPTATLPYELVVSSTDPSKLIHHLWDDQGVEFKSSQTPYTALAHGDTTDTLALVYFDPDLKNLQAYTHNSTVFNHPPVTLDMGADVGRYCSADYDPVSGNLQAAYYDASHSALKLAAYDGVTTQTMFIDGLKTGLYSSMVRTDSEALVAYYHNAEGSLHLARWPVDGEEEGKPPKFGPNGVFDLPPGGTDSVIDNFTPQVGEYCSMAIDSNGRIFIAYYDRGENSLRLASYVNGDWHYSHFFANRGGQYCKLHISPDETQIAIMFYQNPGDSVTLITSTLPAPGPIFSIFFGTELERGGHMGRYGDFCYDAAQKFHLIYYNDLELRPQYSYGGNGQAFVNETIEDNAFDVIGLYNSIAINPITQRPVVAYYAASEGALHYAERQTDATWKVSNVDNIGATGLYSKLLFDPVLGWQYILYYNQSMQQLRLLYRTIEGGPWQPSVVLADKGRGVRPDALVTPGGELQMCLYDEVGGDLLTGITLAPPGRPSRARPAWTQY